MFQNGAYSILPFGLCVNVHVPACTIRLNMQRSSLNGDDSKEEWERETKVNLLFTNHTSLHFKLFPMSLNTHAEI